MRFKMAGLKKMRYFFFIIAIKKIINLSGTFKKTVRSTGISMKNENKRPKGSL